jgi:hypothetical protein
LVRYLDKLLRLVGRLGFKRHRPKDVEDLLADGDVLLDLGSRYI